jgi:hypothetical protein
VRLSIKASKQSQQCAFATAAGAYDGQKFSSGNVDIQIFEGNYRYSDTGAILFAETAT